MRKTSHEGGDSNSVTSGVENEIKKASAVFGKMKRNSIKKKVPNFSQESDVTVIEPLLQTDKEGTDYVDQSANEIISQAKTEINNKNDKSDIIMPEHKAIVSDIPRSVQTINENVTYKTQPSTTVAMHNHMNTNIFNSLDKSRNSFTPKNQILVDIDGCRQVSYSSNPLIFTTAKIHSDGKNKHMEPVQVTPVPILSTVEVSVSKAGKCGEASSNVIQATTSISSTQYDRDSKNIVTFPTRPASMQLKDIASKSITNVTAQGNILNKINVTNTTTTDYTKTAESDLPESSNTTNNEDNILLSTKKVSNIVLKDESNLNALKFPIVHSAVTESSSIDTKLSSTFIKDKNQQIESTKPILKSMDVVGSIQTQQKNNQEIIVTVSSSINNNNKKEAANSSVTHKLLPRQKNTITENLNELILKPKYIESSNSDNGNGIKGSKDCSIKTNSPIKPNVAERDSSSISHEILPKMSTSNLDSNISKPPKTTAITETSMHSTSITSGAKPLLSIVPSCTPTALRTTTTKNTSTTNITSDQNMKKSSITKPPLNTLGSPLTEITYTNKTKTTKPSFTSAPISYVNISPAVSSISQNVANVKSCPTSNTVKTICLPTAAVKSSTPTTTPLSMSTSEFSSSSLSSDKQVGHVNNTAIKSTTNNVTKGQSKLSMATGTNGSKPKQKDLGKDDKGTKS